jgi:adenylate cyclase
MAAIWQIRIYDKQQLVSEDLEVDGPVELGRQSDEGEEPYSLRQAAPGLWRLVIARLDEDGVSRRHALVEPLAGGRARVKTVSTKIPLHLEGGGDLDPGAEREVSLPVVLAVGRKTVRFEEPSCARVVESLGEVTLPPGSAAASVRFSTLALPSRGVEVESLLRWLQGAMDVLHSAATSEAFFAEAARAALDLVGLDAARVLRLRDGEWEPLAVQTKHPLAAQAERPPSRRILERLRGEKKTFWEVPVAAAGGSLLGVKAVLASAILNRQGEVIGALYGERRYGGPGVRPIGRVEAMLLELLAGGVAAGLARLEQEQAALRARVQFEQFFTKDLSRQLELEPDLLRGREEEVTVLFCDICGFSRISGRLGPARTVEWVGEVMDALSECVLAHGGVLIDYIGDELMAMWGAPVRQDDHARRACQAALDMLGRLPALKGRWESVLGEPLRLGIGLNTGVAQVGNVGTKHKFKYGPLGPTVNLASRVQGATRHLKARLLITEATRKQLDDSFATRRLRRVRVVHIDEPVDLYELETADREGWAQLRADYEKALAEFEGGRFRMAARTLVPYVSEAVNDGPSLLLMAQAVRCMVDEAGPFDPVWELPGK